MRCSRLTLAALVAAFLCSTAFAGEGPTVYRTNQSTSQTNATLALFVDGSLGNDSNACTSSGAKACLTIQGAFDKIPHFIYHPVSITIATGTYNQGAFVEGNTFVYDPALQGNNYTPGTAQFPQLIISGTLQNDTIASGSVTGSVASATQGTFGFSSWGTLTVTGAGWTVNDLTGRFVQITGGTGSGQVRPIASNTATVATIVGDWATTPNATSTFAIVVPGTTVKDGLKEGGVILSAGSLANQAGAAFIVREPNAGQYSYPQIIMQNMVIDVTTNAHDGISIDGSSNTVVQQCKFIATANASGSFSRGLLHIGGPAQNAQSLFNVFAPTVARSVINTIQAPFTTPVSRTYITSGWGHFVMRGNYISMPNNLTASAVLFGNGDVISTTNDVNGGVLYDMMAAGALTSAGDYLNVTVSNGIGLRLSAFLDAPITSQAFLETTTFQGNTGTGLYAVDTSYSAQVFFHGSSSVTGFQYAYRCESGGGLISGGYGGALPTPSGSTIADMLSSMTTNTYSATQLNAAAPKRIEELTSHCVFDNQ